MSKKASEKQEKLMSALFRGKEIFKPINTGRIDEHVSCVREYVANAILKLGRSKNGYKKIMYNKSIKERFFLRGYYACAKKIKRTLKYCIILNYICMFIFL